MTTRGQPPAEPPESALRAARRHIAVRQIVRSLQGWRHGEPGPGGTVSSPEENRRVLRRQPWRPAARSAGLPQSILEKIRRFEARARAH